MAEWEHFCCFVLTLKATADSYRAGGGEIRKNSCCSSAKYVLGR
ncbi:hypothetical protein [uncultured Ruminococcus sp.]|nr:hypothetical protein [uncultured Ruminococcus sp.]